MFREKVNTFFIGMAGGVAGVFVIVAILFGVSFLFGKLLQINIECVQGKSATSKGVRCTILDIKDRGETLKSADVISPPESKEETKALKNKTTTGKFVEVKFELENTSKKGYALISSVLQDSEKRVYGSLSRYDVKFWLPSETPGALQPGFKREFVEIFEVPKNSTDFKLRVSLFRSQGID